MKPKFSHPQQQHHSNIFLGHYENYDLYYRFFHNVPFIVAFSENPHVTMWWAIAWPNPQPVYQQAIILAQQLFLTLTEGNPTPQQLFTPLTEGTP